MSKIFNVILLAAVLLVLSGCNDQILPARRVSGQYSDVSEVAITVDPYGGQHVLTMECPRRGASTTCFWAYRYMKGAETPVLFTRDAPAGKIMRYPDVASDNEGGVTLVWQECLDNHTNCVDYYAFGSPFGGTGFPVVARLDPDRNSSGPPKLASNGPYVYAVYEVTDGAGSALRYRQLSPLDDSGGWVSAPDATYIRRNASLAVAPDGVLYVSWLTLWPANEGIFVNNNYGSTGDMVHQFGVNTGNLSAPMMAVTSDGSHLMITWGEYSSNPEPNSDTIWSAWCNIVAHNCSPGGITGATMPATEHWALWGDPAIAASAGNGYIAFSAKNDNTASGYEIFRINFNVEGNSMSPPLQISSNGMVNGQPWVGIVNDFDVVVWRTDGFPPAYGDIFRWYPGDSQPVVIRKADTMNGRPGADMASNGTQMAGVWLEMHAVSGAEQDEAWLAFNTNATYLPLLVAP